MREEHWVKSDSIEGTFTEGEAELALSERMKRSAAWSEHERYHEEHGGKADLILHTERVETDERAPERPFEADEPQTRTRPIMTGWCQCQSPSVRLVLGQDGDIENRPPEPIETNAYGVVSDETPTYSASGSGAVQYRPGAPNAGGLYK